VQPTDDPAARTRAPPVEGPADRDRGPCRRTPWPTTRRQAQYTVGWDPAVGNILIYGGVNLRHLHGAVALALSAGVRRSPDRLHLYVLDLGSGALRAAARTGPHTGAYIGPGDRARQIRLIRMLRAELNTRKAGGLRARPLHPRPAGA